MLTSVFCWHSALKSKIEWLTKKGKQIAPGEQVHDHRDLLATCIRTLRACCRNFKQKPTKTNPKSFANPWFSSLECRSIWGSWIETCKPRAKTTYRVDAPKPYFPLSNLTYLKYRKSDFQRFLHIICMHTYTWNFIYTSTYLMYRMFIWRYIICQNVWHALILNTCLNFASHKYFICRTIQQYTYRHAVMVLITPAWKGKLQQSGLRKEVSAEAKLKAELKKDYLQAKAWLKSRLSRNYDLEHLDHRESSDLDNFWLLTCIKPQKAS